MAELSQVTFPSYLKVNLISTSLVRASLGTNLCQDCVSGCELGAVLLVRVVVEEYIRPPDPISR